MQIRIRFRLPSGILMIRLGSEHIFKLISYHIARIRGTKRIQPIFVRFAMFLKTQNNSVAAARDTLLTRCSFY